MKLVQIDEYLVSTLYTDGPGLQHYGISSYNAQYAPYIFS